MKAIDKIVLSIDLGITYCCSTNMIMMMMMNDDYISNGDNHESNTNFNVYKENTIHDIKHIIELQEDKKFWPFKIINNDGKFYVQINYGKESKEFSPEEISVKEITDAVITVPIHFNNEQRKATKKSGVLAGLNVLRNIKGPTATVMAYSLDRETVLVFDLGDRTFDLSILKINKGLFEVLSTGGDNHLEFRSIEQIKKLLSKENEVNIIFESLYEELNEDIFKRIIKQMEETLKKTKIDEIIMFGGSTNIPKNTRHSYKKKEKKRVPLKTSSSPIRTCTYGYPSPIWPYIIGILCIPNVPTYISNDHEHQNGTINSSLVGVIIGDWKFYNHQGLCFNSKRSIRVGLMDITCGLMISQDRNLIRLFVTCIVLTDWTNMA
ncbi:Hsp70 protein-domain-containing protein [Neocallimastix sp. 'constans']